MPFDEEGGKWKPLCGPWEALVRMSSLVSGGIKTLVPHTEAGWSLWGWGCGVEGAAQGDSLVLSDCQAQAGPHRGCSSWAQPAEGTGHKVNDRT